MTEPPVNTVHETTEEPDKPAAPPPSPRPPRGPSTAAVLLWIIFGVAMLFVGLALWKRNPTLEQAGFYCIVLTAATTVVAGFSGYRDVIVRFDGEAPLVDVKGYLAITLFFVSGALAFTRSRREDLLWNPATMVLYSSGFVACFLLASTLGFLGGVILYGW